MTVDCRHESVIVEYEDAMVLITTCAQCGARIGRELVSWPWPLAFVSEKYGMWRMGQVYGEKIRWTRL